MNKNYIIVENGLFKDSFTEEAVINKELRQKIISKAEFLRSQPVIYTSAEGHITAEEIWVDLRNEISTPTIDLSVMTEQEIINHFDTISNE